MKWGPCIQAESAVGGRGFFFFVVVIFFGDVDGVVVVVVFFGDVDSGAVFFFGDVDSGAVFFFFGDVDGVVGVGSGAADRLVLDWRMARARRRRLMRSATGSVEICVRSGTCRARRRASLLRGFFISSM